MTLQLVDIISCELTKVTCQERSLVTFGVMTLQVMLIGRRVVAQLALVWLLLLMNGENMPQHEPLFWCPVAALMTRQCAKLAMLLFMPFHRIFEICSILAHSTLVISGLLGRFTIMLTLSFPASHWRFLIS